MKLIRRPRAALVLNALRMTEIVQRLCGAVALRVLHPEGVALELLHLCRAQLAPEGVLVVEEDVALPVAGLAGDCLVPVRVLQQHRHNSKASQKIHIPAAPVRSARLPYASQHLNSTGKAIVDSVVQARICAVIQWLLSPTASQRALPLQAVCK